MDQDELEDEIFAKTIWTHLKMASNVLKSYILSNGSDDWQSLFFVVHRREFFVYSVAVICVIIIWLIHSGRVFKRFQLFESLTKGDGCLGSIWQETDPQGTASGNGRLYLFIVTCFYIITKLLTTQQLMPSAFFSILPSRTASKYGGPICDD